MICIKIIPVHAEAGTPDYIPNSSTADSSLHMLPSLRPLTQVSAIEERLDVLDFFLAAQEAASALQQRLAALPDADRLLPKAAAALRGLQLQDEQQQPGLLYQQQQQQVPNVDSCGVLCPASAADPADSVALDSQRAAWKALLNIPTCIMG